jgi:hypothetical protein
MAALTMARKYDIAKADCICRACNRRLAAGEEFVATLREIGQEFHREDYCPPCWEGQGSAEKADLLGFWKAKAPEPAKKKKLFVDDEALLDFFAQLENADTPAKIDLRFVLALVLMRKKLLVYDRAEKLPDGHDAWTMHIKGVEGTVVVIDPRMDEDKIAAVSQQLGQLVEWQPC